LTAADDAHALVLDDLAGAGELAVATCSAAISTMTERVA